MTAATTRPRSGSLPRRQFLVLCGAGSATLVLDGCGESDAETGIAYAPWRFPAPRYADPRLELVHAATLAANPHNTQPWRFEIDAQGISLFADRARSLGAMDPLGREMTIGLGCALENLTIAARHRGFAAEVRCLPDPGDPTHVGRVELRPGVAADEPLYAALAARRTHRGAYEERPLPPAELAALREAAALAPALELRWLADAESRLRFAETSVAATRAIVADEAMSQASYRWYRHRRSEIERHRDGLTLDAQALGTITTTVAKLLPAPSRKTADAYWVAGTRDQHCKHVSAFGILASEDLRDLRQQLAVGRAYQRLQLQATVRGLSMQPLNQAAERRDRELEHGAPAEFASRLAALTGSRGHAQMLFRIGFARDPAHHSPRRGVEQVV